MRQEGDQSTAHIVEVEDSGVVLFGPEEIQSISANMEFWPRRIEPPTP